MKRFSRERALLALAPHTRLVRVVAAMAFAGLLTAACDVHGVSEPGVVSTLTVSPNPQTLAINATQQFTATGTDFTGADVSVTPVWSVVSGGGTITAGGLFTAGTTPSTFTNTVQATSGGKTSTATVIVTAGPLASITVSPTPSSLAVGAAQQFTAVGKDASGNVVAITPSWSVVANGGTIGITSGMFTAGNSTGTFTNTVRASVGGFAGFATVTVSNGPLTTITVTPNPASMQLGGTQQFTAVGKDASGNVVSITPTWSVVNGGGSINGSGFFTAGNSAGTYSNTVKATSGATSGTATVIVTAVSQALRTVTVTPNPAVMSTNSGQQFIATGRDQYGNILSINPVWTVVNGGGSIDANGFFTSGGSTGTFVNTVRADVGTLFGTATVDVNAIAPAPLVNLGAAAPNGIMAGASVTCVANGIINADVSISPGNTITGFGPCVITGVQHLADAVAAQGQIDLTNAYNTLAGLACGTNIVADLGGTTVPAGVYCSASGIGVTGVLTLDGGGDPNATFVFQAGSGLTTAGDVVLINGAQAKNVYWQVGTSATIGTASQWQGNILALTSITLVDNANLFGRALARNGSVTLGTNNVITLP